MYVDREIVYPMVITSSYHMGTINDRFWDTYMEEVVHADR